MDSLTELYETLLVPADEEFAKEAMTVDEEEAFFIKQAEEEDAAGRIMARGFAEELNKLAMGGGVMYGAGKGKCPGCKMAMSKCKCPR